MVYNYTKPRGPIAAMYGSPGPIYMLPNLVGQRNHDARSVHYKGPAWCFGVRHGKSQDDCTPGPCYLPDPKIYKDGKDGSPHYSLYSRPKDGTLYASPGAGSYNPQTATEHCYRRPPAYSFGLRNKDFRTDDTPGPNKYAVDPMLGRTIRSEKHSSPIYSITGRSKIGGFHEDMQRTPGPGTYRVTEPGVYKMRGAAYSMTSRNPMPGDGTLKPGPGAHSPENVTFARKSAPQFSFGIRHSQYKGEFITDTDLE